MLTGLCLLGVLSGAQVACADGWWPFGGSSSTTRRAEPTMWQRMSQGTSSMVQGTQRVLMPWNQPPAPVKERAFPAGAQKVQRISRTKTEESAPWWYPWETIEETSPKYENPADWLSQPRLE
jgi:hypothetical protein